MEGAGKQSVRVLQGQITGVLCPGPGASISQFPQRMWALKLQVHLVNYIPSLIAGSDGQVVIILIGLISQMCLRAAAYRILGRARRGTLEKVQPLGNLSTDA